MASGIFGCVLQIGKVVYEPAMEHGDYLVHYKSHVDNFKNEVESLKNIRGDVIRLVDDACRRKEELKADVEEWLKSVEEVKEDAGRLVNGVEGSAGCLSGWLPNCYVRYNLGKEAKQKMNDVKELQSIGRSFHSVSSSLPRPSTDSMLAGGDYVAFASRKAAVEEIMKALNNEAIGTIGVYGMGGVGKTTLMKEMGKLVKRKGLYDDVVMVEVSLEPKPSKIQAEIAGQLGLKLNEDSQAVRKGQLLERLQGTKTLVILDNVWEQLDLVEIGIPCGPNSQGCKIMLTTRDTYVCNMHGSQTVMIEVRFLTEMESLDLFKVTIGSDVDSSVLEEYGKDIVKECGGIPLLLAAVGTALRRRDKMVWADALTRLRKGSMIGEIFPGLQLSYEFLETNEIKSCFLFCCLFPEGFDIDIETLVRYGFGEEFLDDVETSKEARERVHSLIDKLKARCLLLDGYKDGYVKMHDCVRDVTRSIASKDENGFLVKAGMKTKDWPRKEKLNQCKRISLIGNEISILPAEPDCPNLLTLLFQENYSLEKFPDSFFRGMKSLVVLDLSGTQISTLPCVTTLQVLLLNECFNLTDLSLLGEMEKLEILSLRTTNIRELPEEVGKLSNLKLLDLSYTMSLERLPPNVVKKLRCLEELYMRYSFNAWEVEGTGDGNNASLAEVVSLDRLTMLDIRVNNVECFSQETSFSCTNLSRFDVTCGKEYEMRRDHFIMAVEDESQRKLFRRMSLEISKPVSSFVKFLMERSEELQLVRSKHSDVERWEKMLKYELPLAPKDLRFLKFCNWANPFLPSCLLQSAKMERLWIVDCQKMEKMVQDEDGDAASPVKPLLASAFENLQFLNVRGCIALKNLLSWKLARALEQLKILVVDGCNDMEVIIMNGGTVDTSVLPRLQEIYLSEIPNLKSFCEGEALLELPSLLLIKVTHCSSLKRLPLGPSSALSLQCMTGESILPSNLQLKKRIEPRLEIIGCPTMEKIVPDEDGNMSSPVKALRPSLFENLQFLNVEHCHGLKNLLSWRLARALEQLKELKVKGCNEMEVIIGYGGEVDSSTFPRLDSIHLEDMPKLRCFCEGEVLLELRSLLTIRVIHCSNVKRYLLGPSSALSRHYMTTELILPSNLPLKMIIEPQLEIIGCQTMEKIVPDEDENLPSPVKALRPSLFENLQFLNMQHCHGLKNLLSWRLARALEQLKELKVKACNEMEVIIGYGGEVDSSTFPRLDTIHLEDMPKLRCFCEGEVLLELRSLLTIRVIHCSNVKRYLLGPSSALSRHYMTTELILPSNLPLKMRIEPRLEIIGCQTMEKIVPDEDENLPSLVKALRPSLFENLQFLNMQHCHGLKNLLSWRLARALEQLKELKVKGCNEMEVIIGYGGEVDSSTFPRLHSIHLEDMPKLRCFCEGEVLLELRSLLTIRVIHCSNVKRYLLGPSSALSRHYMTTELILPSNLPLKMRIEPRLEIIGCQTMEKIVPDEAENLPSPVKALRPSLFENLQFLNMQHCHGLKNLLSWRLARALEQLKELKVKACNEMEVIIGYGGEVDSSTFPRLNSIHLEDMPKLRCFCEGEVLLELRSLLTIRVIHCSNVKRYLLGPSSALSCHYMTTELILPSNLPLKMIIQPRLEIIGCLTMEKIVLDEDENLPSPVKALRPSLFENLQFLNMQHCHGFKNLLSWRLARMLEQLKDLKVKACNEMEVIIGYGGEVDSSTFPRLDSIHLEDMPKLRCFCEGEVLLELRSLLMIRVIHCSSLKRLPLGPCSALSLQCMTGESILPSNLQLQKRIEPRLEIIGCPTMEKIVPDEDRSMSSPVKALRPSLFENLQFLNVENCHGLKNLLSWRLARALEQLKELKVKGCNEMEVIIGYGGEVDNSTFPYLDSIHLEDMPKLRCFCEGEVLLELRSLLTIRVIHCSSVKMYLLGPSSALSRHYMTVESILPSNLPLKMRIVPRLEIIGCQTMEKIVPDEDENLPSLVKALRPSLFENLQFLNMQHCHGFKNLLSWRLARTLEQLKELKVQGCNEMEVIIGYGGEVDSSTFPRLHSIHLEDMPKLRCFCEGEVLLELRSLLTIRVIHCSSVKRHLLGSRSALSLQYMIGESILPSNLPLEMRIEPRMEIIGCQTIEKIVPDEYENLPSPAKPLRPSLFENLLFLNVEHCHGLKNLLSWRLVRAFEQLKQLKVQGCNEMEAIIGYAGEVDTSTFPHLHSIHLEDMPKLRSFCEGEVLLELRSLLTIHVIHCSSVKRHLLGPSGALSLQYMTRESILPSNLQLKKRIEPRLKIIGCPTMEKIVPADEDGNMSSTKKALRPSLFENLQFLNVEHCHGLKNLLSWRLARALEQVKELKVKGCNEMEVIIGYGGEVDSSTFPRLHSIHLEDMPKLRCFCEGEVLLELRSLLMIRVIHCSSVKRYLLGPSSALSFQYMTGESILPSNLPLKMRIEPRLEIIGCQTMEKIVPDEDENLPSPVKALRPSLFENLQFLNMQHCHGFKNLLSWRLARVLEQLKDLKVKACNEMEVIIGYGGEVDSSTFPRLDSIHLEDMPKLRCFCEGEVLLELRSLLTIRVIHCSSLKRLPLGPCSVLSLQCMTGKSILPSNLQLKKRIEPRLEIIGCPTMEKIVSDEYENLPSPTKALRPSLFKNLQFLTMQHCHGLKNLLSWKLARVLEQLKVLEVKGCNEMEVIIGYGGEVDTLTFPRLHSIHLEDMPKLRCFCEGEVLLELQSLLTVRVIHCSSLKRLPLGPSCALSLHYMIGESILPSNLSPKMRIEPRLEIIGCQTMENIVPDEDGNLLSPVKALQPSLFKNLQFLNVRHCHGFKNLLSWRLARALEQLKELKLEGCNEMEVVIGDGGEVDSSIFLFLYSIHLEDMPKLRSFCEGEVLLVFRSLLRFHVHRCSNLKRLALGTSSASSLQSMRGVTEWFKALEWVDEADKSRFHDAFRRSRDELWNVFIIAVKAVGIFNRAKRSLAKKRGETINE